MNAALKKVPNGKRVIELKIVGFVAQTWVNRIV